MTRYSDLNYNDERRVKHNSKLDNCRENIIATSVSEHQHCLNGLHLDHEGVVVRHA